MNRCNRIFAEHQSASRCPCTFSSVSLSTDRLNAWSDTFIASVIQGINGKCVDPSKERHEPKNLLGNTVKDVLFFWKSPLGPRRWPKKKLPFLEGERRGRSRLGFLLSPVINHNFNRFLRQNRLGLNGYIISQCWEAGANTQPPKKVSKYTSYKSYSDSPNCECDSYFDGITLSLEWSFHGKNSMKRPPRLARCFSCRRSWRCCECYVILIFPVG